MARKGNSQTSCWTSAYEH